jgi:uncharacterized protein (TIGR03382 family)
VSRFSECFFLVFGQLAVGGAISLAMLGMYVLGRRRR